jgi:hypothetical protein
VVRESVCPITFASTTLLIPWAIMMLANAWRRGSEPARFGANDDSRERELEVGKTNASV